jgi:DNA-binding SARP family transcriptional activator
MRRALLALLLINRGEPVSVDRLVADLWRDDPPASAVKTIHVYVAQLRKVLDDDVLVTRGRAYVVEVDGHELDVDRFEGLAAEGRRRLEAGEAEAAGRLLRDALSV